MAGVTAWIVYIVTIYWQTCDLATCRGRIFYAYMTIDIDSNTHNCKDIIQ